MIGLDELIRLVQQRDPELAALRRDVLTVEASGQRALRPRDPQLRLGYSSTSHSTVPDPFTQVSEETITSTETWSGQRTQTGSQQNTEQRTDRASSGDASERRTSSGSFAEQDREAGTSNTTTTRTRVREVTPDRRGTSVRETIYESTRESVSESATRSGSEAGAETRVPAKASDTTQFTVNGSSDRSTSARGTEYSRVVEQRVEQESYSRDPYEGSDDYSVELRLYPRNPRETRALRDRADAETTLAEFEAETRAQNIRQEVRGSFIAVQFLLRELALMERRVNELNLEVARQEELYEAGQVGIDRYADSRAEAIDARLDRDALRAEADAGRDTLAAWAGLADSGRIDLTGPIGVTRVRPDDLDLDELIDTAWLTRRELGHLEHQDHRLAQDLALARSGRMPWLNLLAGRYTYEERYGGKYRDEFSVVAGFNVPVFQWFRDDDALLRKSREAITRDAQVLREQIKLDVTHALRQLKQARGDLEAYAAEHLAFRKKLQAALGVLPSDTPAARGQRADLAKTLAALQAHELDLTRAYARAVLRLEGLLGNSLDALREDDS